MHESRAINTELDWIVLDTYAGIQLVISQLDVLDYTSNRASANKIELGGNMQIEKQSPPGTAGLIGPTAGRLC